ncbi:hypothetical protein VTN77DRAFT_3329 [Rasamsonia byssochlamydoides]|uniref:uncharacterized protein n=1 Tax=Rasamsonia byssochlamydoides TaxID=89139 RepID=UPI0037421D6E
MNDDDRGSAILAIMWTFVALSTLFVAARLYTRFRILSTIGVDDYLIALSLVLGYVFASLISASVAAGTGRHSYDLTTDQLERALLLSTASFAPGILSFTVPKLGVVALLTRVMNPTPRFKVFLWVLVGGSGLIIFGCVIILYAQCRPTRALWTPTITGSRCWDASVLENYSLASGALSAFVDLFLAVYPATVLWRLQMSRRKKIGLTITLGLGVFACAVSIYKSTRLTELADKTDFTYDTVDVFLWTNIEANTIIIAACVPTITPLIESIFGKRILSSRSGHQSGYMHSKNASQLQTVASMASRIHQGHNNQWLSTATTVHGGGGDVESQKSILGEDDIPLDRITRTDNVIIEYEAAEDDRGKVRRSWRLSQRKS